MPTNNIFSEFIKHYSNAGSIALEPFCGGGVTVVEGLRLSRKVIGVDLNPMATFITWSKVIECIYCRCEVVWANIVGDKNIYDMLRLVFSSTLDYSNRISHVVRRQGERNRDARLLAS